MWQSCSAGCRTGVASGLVAQVDEVALTAALPLAPGASVTVPLFLHPAQVTVHPVNTVCHT